MGEEVAHVMHCAQGIDPCLTVLVGHVRMLTLRNREKVFHYMTWVTSSGDPAIL